MTNIAMKERGDTAANWTSENPTLLDRQMGFETDSFTLSGGKRIYKAKFGDGVTAWNDLPYFALSVAGAGTGDMEASVYDPLNVAGNAFDMENMAEGATKKILTSTERNKLSNLSGTNTGDQDLTQYQLKPSEGAFANGDKTKLDGIEAGADVTDAANVDAAGAVMNSDSSTAAIQFVIDEDSFASNLDTKVPTQQSVKAYADAREVAAKAYADSLVVGLIDDRGNYDASTNVFPSSGGSGSAGAILKGDLWTISVAGTLGGNAVTAGDLVRALVDTPGQTSSNWAVTENNIGYTPENQSNKDTDATFAANSDTKYPSQKAVKTAVDLKAPKADPTFTGTVTAPAIVISGETASRVAIIDASKNVKSADTATYPSLTELAYVKGVTSGLQGQLDGKASSTFVDSISGFIETVSDKTYKIVVKIPFACTINETVTICSSGTATATFKINTTALGGTANSVSSAEETQSQSSANSVSAGDDIQITISSNSSCVDMSFTIKITRTI